MITTRNGNGQRPVLYLDIDDTLVSWAAGHPRAAQGAAAFVAFALERFTVRWLTTWCPSGEMGESLLADLASMLGVEPGVVRRIRGFDWEATGSKLDGIAWLEHLVLNRPFLWIEDNYGVTDRELSFLQQYNLLGAYRHCNVTEDPGALHRLHASLRSEWGGG